MINNVCGYCSYFIMDDIKRMQGHCPFNRYVESSEHESCENFNDRKRYIPSRENFKAILDTFLPCVKDEVKNNIIDRILIIDRVLSDSQIINYWIDHSNDDGFLPWSLAYECPICHGYSDGKNYCPYCGTKNMRKEEEK